jgi:hypothetical protein
MDAVQESVYDSDADIIQKSPLKKADEAAAPFEGGNHDDEDTRF